jgi:hypothetical protein
MSGIFISHNHKDKAFVRRLASALQENGVRVWIDEAEMKVGDVLTDKIQEAIDQMEYLGVVLSNNSIKSEWVTREVNQALDAEIGHRKVKVLPILLDNCEVPGFLRGKLYADFRDNAQFEQGVLALLKRLHATELKDWRGSSEAETISVVIPVRRWKPLRIVAILTLLVLVSGLLTLYYYGLIGRHIQYGPLGRHGRSIYKITFAPNSTTVATGSSEFITVKINKTSQNDNAISERATNDVPSVKIFNAETGSEKYVGKCGNFISSLDFSLSGKYVMAGCGDSAINIWDVETDGKVFSWEAPSPAALGCDAYFLQDGQSIASICDGDVQVRNLTDNTSRQLIALPHTVLGSIISRDRQILALGTGKGRVEIVNVQNGAHQSVEGCSYSEFFDSYGLSHDGKMLAMACSLRSIRLWDLTTMQTRDISFEIPQEPSNQGQINIAFGPDSTKLALITDYTVGLLDVVTDELHIIDQTKKDKFDLTSLDFAPDGKSIAVGGYKFGDTAEQSGQVRFWQVQ